MDEETATTASDDPLIAFLVARLDEKARMAEAMQAWVVPRFMGVEHQKLGQECGRMLREAEATRAVIGNQTSDHAPVETMYGLCCRTCVDWQDAPLAEGGETEFGIAIPHPWPCLVARAAVAAWADHPEFRKGEWAL